MSDIDARAEYGGRIVEPLLRKALQLAQRFDASLRIVHVITPTYAFIPDEQRRSDVEIETTVVRDYPPADALVRQVLILRRH